MEMAQFISKVQEFKNKLKQLGEKISDKLVMTKILMSLRDTTILYQHGSRRQTKDKHWKI